MLPVLPAVGLPKVGSNWAPKNFLKRESDSSSAVRTRLVQHVVKVHDATGGNISHPLFEFFGNPGIIGLYHKFCYLRPLVQRQRLNLLDNVLCVHIGSFPHKRFLQQAAISLMSRPQRGTNAVIPAAKP